MAGVIAPVATQVGLQLLLQPYSHTIGNIACTAVGIIYPAYASFRAVEIMRVRNDTSEAARWLTYWAVFGSFAAVERLLDPVIPWLPYYSTIKLAALLWLQIPRYSGALRLAAKFAYPFLHKAHPHVDAFLSALRQHLNRPEMVAVAAAVHMVLSRIPVLEWFVRGPDGRPIPPPSSSAAEGNDDGIGGRPGFFITR